MSLLPHQISDEADGGEQSTVILHIGSTRGPAMPRDWVHCLVMVEGPEPGRRMLVDQQPVRIGRRAQLEWPLTDPQVSGLHCTIVAQAGDDAMVVTDEHSTNGTFVDGQAVRGTARLPRGGLLQVGSQLLRHDHVPRRELEAAAEISRDLDKARRYVESLLPARIDEPGLQLRWLFQPCQALGGDAFGHLRLRDGAFAVYLIDVSGHGAGAAMHSVSIMNVLRQQALPDTDFTEPAQVLQRLNAMFPMHHHAGMYFSIWYGVYRPGSRRLVYASAGHHPAWLRDPVFLTVQALRTRSPVIGASLETRFRQAEVAVPVGAQLVVFSDGLYEIVDGSDRAWGLDDLRALVEGSPATIEPDALFAAVRAAARPGPLEDDASIVAVTLLSS